MANSMTAADLCSMYKPWKLQVQLVDVIMEEFWQQVKSRASPEKITEIEYSTLQNIFYILK